MSFKGSVIQATVSFDPDNIINVKQSPISNCTNFIENSIGLKIDGNHTAGDFKSMVAEAYTQYNHGYRTSLPMVVIRLLHFSHCE